MNLDIQFAPEIEEALKRRAAEAGQDVATFVAAIVAQQLTEEASPGHRRRSHQEFVRRLNETIAMHPRSGGRLDDSRESIYEGRGE